ncbi:uncharacterized protein ATC70_007585 [Mucor velutinosus]|uniref:Uncharacterized protein n=1 Tax=Mucor velutinosus TaxID=708070 RepID=A0AAN7D7F2_9FUNG|nr:hypothetical protein ATC70_007585 [Mucor velutinosus]
MKLISACLSLLLISTSAYAFTAGTNTTPIIDSLLSYNASMLDTVHAFKGIFFGDFNAEEDTQRFNKSIAVQGNFVSNSFHVNSNATSITCSTNASAMTDFGLVVAGTLTTVNTTVNGAISSLSSTGNITDSCFSNITVDFDSLHREALNISQFFAQQKPNMVIRDGGFLSDGQFLGSTNQDYYVYTFYKCAVDTCIMPDYLYSSPEQIFYGGNWTGPYNTNYPKDKPIVFNIPVLTDTVFNMSTANPAAGLEDANVLYNIFPVLPSGAYDVNGHVVWLRNTTESINGFMLAPSAYVIENNKGGFTDNLMAARYLSAVDVNAMFNSTSTYPDLVHAHGTIAANSSTAASTSGITSNE